MDGHRLGAARAAIARAAGALDAVPNYRRILDLGGNRNSADAAIVGRPASVRSQLQALVEAGATDVWAGVFPVGEDPSGSIRWTYDTLAEVLG